MALETTFSTYNYSLTSIGSCIQLMSMKHYSYEEVVLNLFLTLPKPGGYRSQIKLLSTRVIMDIK